MGSKTQKVIFGIFLLCVAAIIYCLNYFTPMASDDWNYVFIYGTDQYIHNLWDVVKSQYTHYLTCNGRTVVHTLLQAVEALLGKGIFNVLNTLVFVVLLYAIAINVTNDKRQYYKVFSVAFILLFLLYPGFDLGVLWLSGSFNYLWTATALLFFHYMLEKKQFSNKANLPLFLCGILCGWTNEAFVVGLAGAYFIYFATHPKSLTKQRCFMLAGFFLGALFLVFAPSSVERALEKGPELSHVVMLQTLASMSNLRMTIIMLFLIPLLALTKWLKIGQWFKREQIFIMALLISFVFVWFTRHFTAHSRFGIELFALMLIMRAIPWERLGSNMVKAITVANAVTIVIGIMAIHASYKCSLENERELSQIRRHEYPIQTRIADFHPFFDRFIVAYEYFGWGEHRKFFGTSLGINKYFHNDSVFFLPEGFVQAVKQSPERFDTFQTHETWPFYAIRANAEDSTMTCAVLELTPIDYNRFIWPFNRLAPKMHAYTNCDIPVEIQNVTLDGIEYIIATKRPVIEDRVKKISLSNAY